MCALAQTEDAVPAAPRAAPLIAARAAARPALLSAVSTAVGSSVWQRPTQVRGAFVSWESFHTYVQQLSLPLSFV